MGPLSGLLVHRRLSIIDLKTGDQPMGLTPAGPWIVFNGEIYNYRELRAELQRTTGAVFRTNSDTEVILAVYASWGISGFGRLNGIFAFALYDAARRELVLARDPVGVKPLYWASGSHEIAFASEVRPLLATGYARRDVDPESVAQYLFYRFVPSPRTLWRGVHKVACGHALRFGRNGTQVGEADFASPVPQQINPAGDPADFLAPRFLGAVERQMVADVPVGAFLSGGLDSTLVVEGMRRAQASPTTFGIGFADTPGVVDERRPARQAASLLGTRHEGIAVQRGSYFSRFPAVVLQVEEPLAEAGMLLLSDISGAAASQLKVVLTGQGADEPLGGYPRHQAIRLAMLLGRLPGGRKWARLVTRRDRLARFLRVLGTPSGPALAAAPFSAESPESCGAFARGCGAQAGADAILEAVTPWWRRSEGMDDLARVLYVDVRTSLADDLLLMGDKTAMSHGLEARVPFLDLEYLAAVESLPGPSRIPLWRRRKWIQHGLARRLLPPALARALAGPRNPFRTKLAFEVPMDGWLRGALGGRLADILMGGRSMLPEYVDRMYVERVLASYLTNKRQSYRTVLALYVLELWLRGVMAEVPVAELPAA